MNLVSECLGCISEMWYGKPAQKLALVAAAQPTVAHGRRGRYNVALARRRILQRPRALYRVPRIVNRRAMMREAARVEAYVPPIKSQKTRNESTKVAMVVPEGIQNPTLQRG
jgi:hypothetical protein